MCSKAMAMSYEQAREEAFYLTDKMAYELNLNDQQYNDAYEINLDYLLSLNTEADLYSDYMHYRIADLQYILYDWQYQLLLAADYFLHPVLWRPSGWYFPVYSYYSRHHFFYERPRVYWDYRGGHGRMHYHGGMYYSNRRPEWNGGRRGMERSGLRRSEHRGELGTRSGREIRGETRGSLNRNSREIRGNGYRMTLPDRESGRSLSASDRQSVSSRGNSFTRSSSRQGTPSAEGSMSGRSSVSDNYQRGINGGTRSMGSSPSRGISSSSSRGMGSSSSRGISSSSSRGMGSSSSRGISSSSSRGMGNSISRGGSNGATRSGGMGGSYRGGGRRSR